MYKSLPLLALGLAASTDYVHAQKAGSIVEVGSTLVSAMMMFLGNNEKVYILDKTEGNNATIDGHPAWGSVWDINSHQAEVMEVLTNTFCASGMHLPNGSFATFGGNGAIGPGGNIGSVKNSAGSGAYDATYEDYDGTKSIRILNPCSSSQDMSSAECQWFDNATVLSMQKQRWYSAAEALGDGTIALIGGFVNGGYINRNTPNTDPEYEGGAAEPTYEFYPTRGPATVMQFMIQTSGLNSYAHTYLMPSGKMLVQANVSTMLWDPDTNEETALPNMPGNVARVYPASGAVAMLPLTPANNYTPTVLFCGGTDMPDQYWGNYSFPNYNTWNYPASTDCQRITPEPQDGSTPAYEQDDDLLEGRTMGQFIALPDGTMLVVNGGRNGTAGYAQATGQTPNFGDMAYGESLAAGPVGTPAIYNPNMPKGQRWSNAGLGNSNIARLYHSSAILLPDASVMIAGSNPNIDVNWTTIYPTTYTAEVFYPPYFSASVRPQPSGMPQTLSYGGNMFNLTVPSSSYTGSANAAAANTSVVLVRGGFTTHAMNMGQRHMELRTSYTVNDDGSYVMHVAQPHPNPNIFQPGPALLFVNINGIPSNGSYVILGSGKVETQATSDESTLPSAQNSSSNAQGSGSGSNSGGAASSHTGTIVGAVIGSVAAVALLGALFGVCVARRRRAAAGRQAPLSRGSAGGGPVGPTGTRSGSEGVYNAYNDKAWGGGSTASLQAPLAGGYRDEHEMRTPRGSFDPAGLGQRPSDVGSYAYGGARAGATPTPGSSGAGDDWERYMASNGGRLS